MKETVRSLRAYLIIVGLVSTNQLLPPLQRTDNAAFAALIAIGLGFSIAWVVAGIRLPQLLATRPRTVERIISGSGLFLLTMIVVALFARFHTMLLAELVVGVLLTRYLVKNVRRLAAET